MAGVVNLTRQRHRDCSAQLGAEISFVMHAVRKIKVIATLSLQHVSFIGVPC